MAVKIHSGDLRYKVQVLAPAESQNEEGGRERSFSIQVTTWAAVRNMSNFRVEDPTALLDTKEFFIRYVPTRVVSVDHLLIYNGHVYVVNGVEVVEEQQRFIKITAKNKGGVADYLQTVSQGQVINDNAEGGETEVVYPELIGKTILLVLRSGFGVKLITTGTPISDEVLFTSTTGTLTFGAALSPQEWVYVLYG